MSQQTTIFGVRLRPVRPAGWWFDAVLVAAFVLMTWALMAGYGLAFDEDVSQWLIGIPAPLHWLAEIFNNLGQGGKVLMPVSGILAVWLIVRTRSARPVLVFAAVYLLTALTIGPIKVWTERAAPKFPPANRTEFFNDDAVASGYAVGYPSGHVVNSIIWYGAIALLLAGLVHSYGRTLPTWVYTLIAFGPPIIVSCTTTALRHHWISDTVAGLLLGVVLHRIMLRIPWDDVPLPRFVGEWARPAGLDPVPR